jgi:hypothetical protein
MMLMTVRKLLRNDRGVVTADWTALTGGMVLLGFTVLYDVMRSAEPLVDKTTDTLDSMTIGIPTGDKPDFSK